MQKTLQPKIILTAILAAYAMQQHAVAAENGKITTNKVEVISTTPLAGVGLPLEKIPLDDL